MAVQLYAAQGNTAVLNGNGTGISIGSAYDNRLLVVTVGGGNYGTLTCTLRGYGALTRIANANYTTRKSEIYYYLNPPTGTLSVDVNNTGSQGAVFSAFLFVGVDQVNPFRWSGINGAVTQYPVVGTDTAPQNGDYLLNALGYRFTTTGTPSASYNETIHAQSTYYKSGSAYKAIIANGAVNTGWNLNAASDWALSAVVLRQHVAATMKSQLIWF
jgi:hypothetical protein